MLEPALRSVSLCPDSQWGARCVYIDRGSFAYHFYLEEMVYPYISYEERLDYCHANNDIHLDNASYNRFYGYYMDCACRCYYESWEVDDRAECDCRLCTEFTSLPHSYDIKEKLY